MKITSKPFGTNSYGESVSAYCIENAHGSKVTVLDHGCTVQSLCVPDRAGTLTDVVLGFSDMAGYNRCTCYMGACIGRVAGRISNASFVLSHRRYTLPVNEPVNKCLHGGERGFDKHVWNTDVHDNSLVFTRISPDGEQGFPGELIVRVSYEFTDADELIVRYHASSDALTPVSLTNHSYFNLSGGGSVLSHTLSIDADRFIELDSDLIPTGKLLDVAGTPFDFRSSHAVGRDIDADDPQISVCSGYDHAFELKRPNTAKLYSPESGIAMCVCTKEKAVLLYTSNFLDERGGKNGVNYTRRQALCLETHAFPNAINTEGFAYTFADAENDYNSETVYAFSTED